MLSHFLTGDLLKVYKVRGGRKLRYSDMRRELLKYYKEQKIGTRSFWRKQLSNVVLDHEEEYDIFAMRISELAKLAYPKDKRERKMQVRNYFFNHHSSSIVTKITDAERTYKA